MMDDKHVDEDSDHKCDNCESKMTYLCEDSDGDGRCEVCAPECEEHSVNYDTHRCDNCNMILPCYSDDGDLYCDICYEEMECHHDGMEGEHVCMICYDYLSDCVDEDGDGECDLSGYFPHSPEDNN